MVSECPYIGELSLLWKLVIDKLLDDIKRSCSQRRMPGYLTGNHPESSTRSNDAKTGRSVNSKKSGGKNYSSATKPNTLELQSTIRFPADQTRAKVQGVHCLRVAAKTGHWK